MNKAIDTFSRWYDGVYISKKDLWASIWADIVGRSVRRR